MGVRLGDATGGRDNNLNLLRFIAASIVLFTHSVPIALGPSAHEPLVERYGISMGTIAVDVFFVASGLLVTASIVNRGDVAAFARARLLRIWPALLVAIFACAFVLGPLVTSRDVVDYYTDGATWKHVARNATLFFGVEFDLPGVFESNPYADSVNGSLWTLPWEVRMYVLLAVAWAAFTAIGRRSGRDLVGPGLVAAAVIATVARVVNHSVPFAGAAGPRLASMFFVGAACYVLRSRIVLSHGVAAVLAAALLAAALHPPTLHVVYAVAVPYLVFYLAYVPAGAVRGYNRLGDYSYGMYVYAFPVQQVIVERAPGLSVAGLIAIAFPVTLALAVASWTFVEKPMLARKA